MQGWDQESQGTDVSELGKAKKKKPNKNEFYRYTGQKKLSKDSVPPMVNEQGKLFATDTEEAEELSEFFASIFTNSQSSHASYIPTSLSVSWWRKTPPSVRANLRLLHDT